MTKKKHPITTEECNSVVCMRRPEHPKAVFSFHKKKKISYRTLFYMQMYGPKSHIVSVIMKESIKILLFASILSSIGGLQIKNAEHQIIAFLPLLILMPALNDMIGDFGAIVSSKFTTLLFLGKVKDKWWRAPETHELVFTILFIALISVFYIAPLAYFLSFLKGFEFSYVAFFKIVGLAMVSTFILILLLLIISVAGSFYIFKKKEDPNNFMIPIVTSVADLGSLLVFTTLVSVFF